MSNNPYAAAAGAYASSGNTEKNGRDLEADVLIKSSQRMALLCKRLDEGEDIRVQEIGDVLDINQKIWQVFVDNIKDPESPLPQEIKNNIGSLALFIFKRTHEIHLDKELNSTKIQALIDINLTIAAGLSKKVAGEVAGKTVEQAKDATVTTHPQTQATVVKKPSETDGNNSSLNIDL